jgi:O-antigen/teichoic acid export membrane protein
MFAVKLRSLFEIVFARHEPQSPGRRRYRSIAHAVLTGAAGKGVNLLVLLVSVPLALSCLGVERYGIWIAMTSVLSWLSIADIGLGNGLMNLLADARGRQREDLAQRYVATTFWGLAVIAATLAALALPVVEHINWQYLLNIRDAEVAGETRTAMLVAVWCFLLALPLGIVSKVYVGYQQGAPANAWAAAGSLAELAAIVLVTRARGGLVALTIAVLGIRALALFANACYLFGYRRPDLAPSPWRIDLGSLRTIFGVGMLFFLGQMQSLLVFQSDVLIISHFLGPGSITPYSVTCRLFAYVNVPLQLASPYFLAAFGEAHGRGDLDWVRLAFRRLMLASLCWTLPLIFVLDLGYRLIISKWAGAAALPDQGLVLWMSGWTLLLAMTSPMFIVLTATRNFARMVGFAYVAAALNVLLAVILVQRFGVEGVSAAMVIANAACCVAPYVLETLRFFRRSVPLPHTVVTS